jgi:fibronectin type 3 domain-containing protein
VKSVRISWNPIDDTDIDGYNIYRGTDNNNIKKITYVKGNKSDNYIDKGDAFIPLEDGKTYFYAISGVNLFEAAGPVSPSVKAVTKPRPAPVNGLKASAEADHISINWEKSSESDIKSYFVYRSVSSGSILSSPAGGAWSKLKELSADQTSYIDFDLKQESIYIYRIISEDKDGLKSDPAESGQVISPIVKQEKLK